MTSRREKLLQYMRGTCLAFTAGIILLSVESLITHQQIFRNYAMGLLFLGMIAMSLLIAWIVKTED